MTRIATGMLMAAGHGTRMRPLTDTCPKPLLAIRGRSMLDRALDQMEAAGLSRIVVNTCYLADKIESALAARAPGHYVIDHENKVLESGGDILAALPLLGTDPFFVMNGDGILQTTSPSPFERLTKAWDATRMDALLLVMPAKDTYFLDAPGSFILQPDGHLAPGTPEQPADMAYIGLQILSPHLFDGYVPHTFPLRRLYARAMKAGRLFGLPHTGAWLHIGTPQAYADAPALMERLGLP